MKKNSEKNEVKQWNAIKLKLKENIVRFFDTNCSNVLTFDMNSSSIERMLVHEIAQESNLGHVS